MNYPDSVQFLYSLGNEVKTAKFGLERIFTLLDALGNPHRVQKVVHVAGTNGKGSTCAMIESALRVAGVRTGLFTSPHLLEPTERIRIAGEPVTDRQFTDAFVRVHQAAEELLDQGRIDLHPTYFETVTAMAFLLFAELEVEKTILEVGLGGRLDATNVVIPELAVITPVDFDHEQFLGRSLESIAREKAGILKPGVPAVMAPQRPEVEAILTARAAELAVPVTWTDVCQVDDLDAHAGGSDFTLSRPGQMRIHCPLPGDHQTQNALTAITVLDRLGVATSAIQEGIAQTCWPGRLERISEDPEIILDGAHNPASARALAAYIQRFYCCRRVKLIFGVMRDKAVTEIAGVLFPLVWEVILTAANQARAARPETIAGLVSHPRLHVVPRLEDAIALVRGSSRNEPVFITGSLFLVGEAKALL